MLAWAASGGMALTGYRGGAPVMSPAPAFELLRAVSATLASVTGQVGERVLIDPAATVFGRAGRSRRERDGRRSVGGASRILRTADGWCAVTLARAADFEAVPAILGDATASDAWAALTAAARRWPARTLAERAQLLGVPAAVVPPRPWPADRHGGPERYRESGSGPPPDRAEEAGTAPPSGPSRPETPSGQRCPAAGSRTEPDDNLPGTASRPMDRLFANTLPWNTSRLAAAVPEAALRDCLVVDLSALWAGPLCARLLAAAGARVVKVESVHRPDSGRAWSPEFFRWLHEGKEFRSVEFRTEAGRRELAALLDAADIVVEAARPRALAHLGLAPEQLRHRPGRVWLSLTGYGRAEPMRVAFGDDAAAAGGLLGWGVDGPMFCGDAIADPLSGICAALAVATAVRAGGGVLLDLSMRATAAAFAAAPAIEHGPHRVVRHGGGWSVECAASEHNQPVLAPPAGAGC
ncbi:CoA transferase [Nocardia sp. NPDC048505]|uniref:CoA transferase n=1 Tax=unclassified Nocardia TaxID=2637762 RepID=UPI0033E4630B